MKKDEIVNELYESAYNNGLIPTLHAVFGKRVKVRVPFSQKVCDTEIDDFEFSVRARNSLRRAGLHTVGDIIDSIAKGDLISIRNLGDKTKSEIQTKLLSYGYAKLTETEKKRFFYDVVNNNCG